MARRCLFLAAVVAAACSSFGEAASPGSDAGEAGAVGDAGTSGSMGPGDGSTSDGGRFCATVSPAPFLCADFDDGTLQGFMSTLGNGGQLAIDDAGHVSPPNALALGYPVPDSNVTAMARRQLPSNVTAVSVDLEVFFGSFGSGDLDILALQSGPSAISIQVLPTGELEFDEDTPDASPITKTVPPAYVAQASWAHLRWENRLDGPALTSKLFVNGNQAGSVGASPTIFATPQLQIGDRSVDAPNNWRIRVDNVVVYVQ